MCQTSDSRLTPGQQFIGVPSLTAALIASSIVAATFSTAASQASAQTKIEGGSDAVSLSVEDAPIGEVLADLSVKFGFTYTQTAGLDRTIGGTYSGTLRQVLARILDGCDYVVSYSGDKIELKVMGRSNSTAHQPSFPSPPGPPAAPAGVNPPPPGQVSAK